MAKITSLRVNERNVAGKGAARAERRAGLIPGVIYGEKKAPIMFSISALDLDAQMRQKGFWTRQFEIEVGKNKCHAHIQCDSIIMDHAEVGSIPEIQAKHVDAAIIHEAAIGRINDEQLLKLRTLGLTEEEAENVIIQNFLN